MKVLLCTVPLNVGAPRDESQLPVMPKIAIVSLIKWMERYGYTSKMYDFYDIDMLDPSDDEIQNYFESCQPTVVGLSAVVSTAYLQVKRIAKIIRQTCPDAWIVMGGNLAASANVVLRKTDVDICVQGDGEIPWVEFLDYVKKFGRQWNYKELSRIKGLTYIDEKGEMQFNGYSERIPASRNPFPDYDILALGLKERPELLQNYFREGLGSYWFRQDPRSYEKNKRPKSAAFWTSKGCVGRCTFCQRSTKGYRPFDLKVLDVHLELLKERYNVGFIQIIDENFGGIKKHAYEVAKLMKKHDMLWISGGIRCRNINAEDVKYYRDHLCVGLKFGVESGSQKILDLMEKKFTIEQVREAVGYCIENNVYSPLAVMTGMPGETDETARETGEFLGTLAHMQGIPPSELGIAIFYALPLPGTPLYEYGQQVGIIGATVEEEEEYLVSVSDDDAGILNYINLNGLSMKKVVYWKTLIKLEATRTFYKKQRKKSINQKKNFVIRDKIIFSSESRSSHWFMSTLLKRIINSYKKGRLTFSIYYTICRVLNGKFANSRLIARLPQSLVDGLGRNVNYIMFVVERTVFRIKFMIDKRQGRKARLRNLYKKNKLPKQITDNELLLLGDRGQWSLRNIVKVCRESLPEPVTLTEKYRQILIRGR